MQGEPTGAPATRPDNRIDDSRPVRERPHFPGFEGLRALAASLVVVHHAAAFAGADRAGPLATPAAVGDMGVSIFFVISGFLIYRPFLAAHLAGRPPMRTQSFWWRRVLRIVPAYWAALTVLWAVGAVEMGQHWWRHYLFLHIYDRFSTFAGIIPSWSLGTEMAFYALIPLYAVLLGRVVGRAGRTTLPIELAGVGALLAVGYLSRFLFSALDGRVTAGAGPLRFTFDRAISFTWLPNNIDLFALGMALAVLHAWVAHTGRRPAVVVALSRWPGAWWAAAIGVYALFAYRVGPPSPGLGYRDGYWQGRQLVAGVVAVCLLAPAVFGDQKSGAVRRALQWPPVVAVGVVSYGLYLWHHDLLGLALDWLDRPLGDANLLILLVAGFGLGLAAAAASWFGLERPLQRRFKRRRS